MTSVTFLNRYLEISIEYKHTLVRNISLGDVYKYINMYVIVCFLNRKYHGYCRIVIFCSYRIDILIFQYRPTLCTYELQDTYAKPGDDW